MSQESSGGGERVTEQHCQGEGCALRLLAGERRGRWATVKSLGYFRVDPALQRVHPGHAPSPAGDRSWQRLGLAQFAGAR